MSLSKVRIFSGFWRSSGALEGRVWFSCQKIIGGDGERECSHVKEDLCDFGEAEG